MCVSSYAYNNIQKHTIEEPGKIRVYGGGLDACFVGSSVLAFLLAIVSCLFQIIAGKDLPTSIWASSCVRMHSNDFKN